MDLKLILIKKLPEIKLNSLNAYVSNINKLNKNKPYDNIDFILNVDNIKKIVSDKKISTQRNYFMSCFIVLKALDPEKYKNEIKEYHSLSKKIQQNINEDYKKHEMTPKENENWLSCDELHIIFNKYEKLNSMLYQNFDFTLTNAQKKDLLYYMIASLYTLHSPLRLDWATLKVIKYKKEMNNEENFLLDSSKYKKVVYLNDFKNVKSLGPQIIEISKELCKVINLYRKYNKNEYFLNNFSGEKMTTNVLSKTISKVFFLNGKHANLNMIRKCKIKTEINFKEVQTSEKLAGEMLHAPATQQKVYLKH
tara:strand:+ start:35 stop:958 length:924 start_codon:yes stop_codon:yes gene_type:complete